MERCFSLLDRFDVTIVSSNINKRDYKGPADIYDYAYKILLSRLNTFSQRNGFTEVRIVSDPRQAKQDRRLAVFHDVLKEKGDYFAGKLTNITLLQFRKSISYPGIQLGDLFAYSICRALHKNDPQYQFFHILRNYFAVGDKGQIIGSACTLALKKPKSDS